jgi:hypothetical protein
MRLSDRDCGVCLILCLRRGTRLRYFCANLVSRRSGDPADDAREISRITCGRLRATLRALGPGTVKFSGTRGFEGRGGGLLYRFPTQGIKINAC